MSDYQYYEFCSINTPLSSEAKKEMASLSSRSKVGTHGASYVYNYGDFRGNPNQLVLKHFDVFFYISNFGTVRLLFKYSSLQVSLNEIKKYCIKHVINTEVHNENILLDIYVNNEEGFGWTEGEGILPDLLPLYDEIKSGNYQFLQLINSIHEKFNGKENAIKNVINEKNILSEAQERFIECIGIEIEEINK